MDAPENARETKSYSLPLAVTQTPNPSGNLSNLAKSGLTFLTSSSDSSTNTRSLFKNVSLGTTPRAPIISSVRGISSEEELQLPSVCQLSSQLGIVTLVKTYQKFE